MRFRFAALCLLILLCTSYVPAFAPMSNPSFEGTWDGKAQVTTCSRSSGTTDIVLKLEDKGYNPDPKAPGTTGMGSVSGYLEIHGASSGVVALYYDPGQTTLKSAIGSVRSALPSPLGGPGAPANSPFSTYWITLKAGDPSFGFGHYQSLTGTLSSADSSCPNLQDAAIVMKVTLKKR